MAQQFNTVLLALILVVLCVLVALVMRQPQSTTQAGGQTRSPHHRQHHTTSRKVAPTVTPVPGPTRRPHATVTPQPATATLPPTTPTTPTPPSSARIYHSGDPILIVWPQKGQVWESAYWDGPDEGTFNELPGPGNRCSNAVSGLSGPLTATCFIPRDATPGYHTITLGEFRDYNGGTIATQYLKIFVSDESAPTVEPPTATPDMQSI